MMYHFSVLIQWSNEDEAYIATVPELPELSAAGDTPEKAVEELVIAQEAYLEVLKEDEEEIPEPDVLRPFSGQTRIRLPKSLHASLAHAAKKEGVSLNTYIVQLLSERHAYRKVQYRFDIIEQKLQNTMLNDVPFSGGSTRRRQN